MKLKEFQEELQREKIDLSFFTHPDPNITYFTQTTPSHALLIITPKHADFYLTKLDSFPVIKKIKIKEYLKSWTNDLKNEKVRKVGINKDTLTLSTFEKLKETYPQAKFVDITFILNGLRMEKTTLEINLLARACKVTSDAFNSLLKELPKGNLKTEQEVATFLEKFIRSKDCQLAFPTIVAMGKNAAVPHHVTSNSPLTRGPLLMDFGAKFKNYHADMTRVIFLEKSTKEERTFYNLLLNSQKNAISSICENVSCSKIDQQVRKNLNQYSSYFIHALGHGVGVEIHEHPSFKDENRRIHKNHVFTIEPGIYFPGKFGFRIEDTLVFDGKTKVLTTATKELLEIPFK
jgi:Xaa-Pro aminopeptidase